MFCIKKIFTQIEYRTSNLLAENPNTYPLHYGALYEIYVYLYRESYVNEDFYLKKIEQSDQKIKPTETNTVFESKTQSWLASEAYQEIARTVPVLSQEIIQKGGRLCSERCAYLEYILCKLYHVRCCYERLRECPKYSEII